MVGARSDGNDNIRLWGHQGRFVQPMQYERQLRELSVPTAEAQAIEEPLSVVEPAPVLTGAEGIICQYAWSCETALYVARRESGSDYIAGANYLNCVGTFQLHPIHHWRFYEKGWDPYSFDIAQNVQVAFELWLEQGWEPWV